MLKKMGLFCCCIFYSCSNLQVEKRELEKTANLNLPQEKNDLSAESLWWNFFANKELQEIVENALSENFKIAEYVARLKQSSQLLGQISGQQNLTIDIEGSAQADKIRKTGHTEKYQLGLAASYELDLWGKLIAKEQAALENYHASFYELQAIKISIAAQIVNTYFEIISQADTIELINNQILANKEILEGIEKSFTNSGASTLDVLNQRQILAQTQSLLPESLAKLKTLQTLLNVLQGKSPLEKIELKSKKLPQMPPLPDTGFYAEIMKNRPDIKQAFANLKSVDWTFVAAKADRYPGLKLTGSWRYNSTEINDIFDNWVANLAAGIVMPILDGNYRKLEVERIKFQVEERLAAYKNVVFEGIKEIDDALNNEKHQRDLIIALENRVKISTQARNTAFLLFRNGKESYIKVWTALIELQGLQRQLISANFQLYNYRVNLYRALGCGWNEVNIAKNIEKKDDKNN